MDGHLDSLQRPPHNPPPESCTDAFWMITESRYNLHYMEVTKRDAEVTVPSDRGFEKKHAHRTPFNLLLALRGV